MMDAILNAAATPQGLIILVVLAFIVLTLVITAVFFIVAGLLPRFLQVLLRKIFQRLCGRKYHFIHIKNRNFSRLVL